MPTFLFPVPLTIVLLIAAVFPAVALIVGCTYAVRPISCTVVTDYSIAASAGAIVTVSVTVIAAAVTVPVIPFGAIVGS